MLINDNTVIFIAFLPFFIFVFVVGGKARKEKFELFARLKEMEKDTYDYITYDGLLDSPSFRGMTFRMIDYLLSNKPVNDPELEGLKYNLRKYLGYWIISIISIPVLLFATVMIRNAFL